MQNCVSICEGEVSQIGHGLGSDGLEASLRGMCAHQRRTTGTHNTETHILVFCKVGWRGRRGGGRGREEWGLTNLKGGCIGEGG